jgi:very-short-patch-repair endonuclease
VKRYPKNAIGRARHLRREMTLPEQKLWKALRQPDIGFRRQVPIGRYIVDFVHLRARVVIELDGGWHDFPEAQLHDAVRDEWLTSQGYRVLRFRNQQALDDPSVIVEAIRTLLPQGEKGRDEGVRAELWKRDAETPPALLLRSSALTLTQPSPLEGEGFAIEGEGENGVDW